MPSQARNGAGSGLGRDFEYAADELSELENGNPLGLSEEAANRTVVITRRGSARAGGGPTVIVIDRRSWHAEVIDGDMLAVDSARVFIAIVRAMHSQRRESGARRNDASRDQTAKCSQIGPKMPKRKRCEQQAA